MKKSSIVLFLVVACFTSACSHQSIVETGKIYPHIPLEKDTSLSYAIYIPKKIKTNLAFIFFDPHGSGFLPVQLYQPLADEFGITLIGNNNSANGMDFSLIASHFAALLNEIKKNYLLNEAAIALWGFSGGAKAALFNTGFKNNIQYCIYGGAVSQTPNNNTNLLGFNGKQDMNYTDLLEFALQQSQNAHHFQIEFNGKHAWVDTATAKDAFRWLLLEKMRHKEIPTNPKIIQDAYNSYQKEVKKARSDKQYLVAYQACIKAIYLLKSTTDINYFVQQREELSKMPLLKKEVEKWQTTLQQEVQLKSQYSATYFSKDTVYWKSLIEQLQKTAPTDVTGMQARLLGFLSLMSYSYAVRAFAENNLAALSQILFIYQHADPTNAEQAFMRAKLFLLENNIDGAKAALQDAIQLGIDSNRIAADATLKEIIFSIKN
ncbi:MAG TPA: hypothetical protein PKM51_06205 [Chitinophagales bacterium]|nr:hypothetical protein [Chitinophagales bacterium]HNM32321.1 hypothetical protein [Chitinophagales bacterium]